MEDANKLDEIHNYLMNEKAILQEKASSLDRLIAVYRKYKEDNPEVNTCGIELRNEEKDSVYIVELVFNNLLKSYKE